MKGESSFIIGVILIALGAGLVVTQPFSAALDPNTISTVPQVPFAQVIDFERGGDETGTATKGGFIIKISDPADIDQWRTYRYDTEKSYFKRKEYGTLSYWSMPIVIEGEAQVFISRDDPSLYVAV